MPLITPVEIVKETPYKGLIQLQCDYCDKFFSKTRYHCFFTVHGYVGRKFFCCKKCQYTSRLKSVNDIFCKQCNKVFLPSHHADNKRIFCSKSCAAIFNNTHKKHGTRRSKLELWLETQLTTLYPNIQFHFNKKDAINSELDIYIPSLNLAFELNGIFHYEPIFGSDLLSKIKNNDCRKFQACLEKQIELCVIDTSFIKYLKKENSEKILDIIISIINNKLQK